ncbi:amino acid ABC transporter permease [Paenibacillus sp. 481]|uniref:amino acid ABC transporter permease n=1 Tax=Paenibacillus sp. 481 TaxID=2835869 RepID=UPI001E2C7F59|nr:amino acid ABC transporter permease [Paenibacillus sp. 481]UHA73597.1 amino acid ABC transporter permease [Paenibacillus sp. 481]
MSDFFNMLWENKDLYISGAIVTLELSFFAVIFGSILGAILVFMKLGPIKPISWVATVYIEIFRGTPLIVQLFIVYFGLPQFGIEFDKFIAGVIALSLNSAAYLAEIFRTGIQSIDKGQLEAARSLGMTKAKAMRYIILPQALRTVIPTIANEFVVIIKESAIVCFIGLADIFYQTGVIRSQTYTAMGPLVGSAMTYFILTFTLSKLIGYWERKLKTND